MEAKYTKGPWWADKESGYICAPCTHVATVNRERDMSLIAAVPELLEELQRQMTAINCLLEAMDIDPDGTFIKVNSDGDSVAKVTLAELAARAQAVCAKALGGAK